MDANVGGALDDLGGSLCFVSVCDESTSKSSNLLAARNSLFFFMDWTRCRSVPVVAREDLGEESFLGLPLRDAALRSRFSDFGLLLRFGLELRFGLALRCFSFGLVRL